MASRAANNIDYRLLNRMSNLVICSCCLRRGKITPVPQLISDRHSLTNHCAQCRNEATVQNGRHRAAAKVLTLQQ